MSMTQKFRRYSSLFLAVFMLSSLFLTIPLSTTVSAAAPAGSTIVSEIDKQVRDHQKYYWLRACMYFNDIDQVTRDEMKNWDFFEGSDGDNGGSFYQIIGNYYGADKDGTWGCETGENVENAFNALGVTDPKEAFCKIDGARYNDSDGYDYDRCFTGAGTGDWNNVAGDKGKTQASDFENEAAKWAPNVITPITDAQNYVRYYASFMQQCDVGLQEGEYQEGDADADDKYRVPVINSTSKDIQYIQGVGIPSKNSEVAIVAQISGGEEYTRGESVDAQPNIYARGTVISCNTAVERLREYAPAYLAYFNTLPEDKKSDVVQPGASSGTTQKTCESEGGPLAWLLCAVLSAIDGAISFLDQTINQLLFIDKDVYAGNNISAAWAVMRNIALFILVPMMMFMVIGTAVGFGPFDAYTVKKALPRMFIAVIFIVLSLPITQFGVELSNAVGQGAGNLIINAGPDANRIDSLEDIFKGNGNGNDVVGFGTLVAAGAAIATVSVTIGILFSFALVTLVALLIGFVILVMRQVLILLLIVIAPLAILVWIFPGNDKLWGIWKTTFIAMLFLYPIISMLIASGKFVAGLVG